MICEKIGREGMRFCVLEYFELVMWIILGGFGVAGIN